MSGRSSPSSIFIACLSLLFLFAFPQVSHSQSAIGQLETMTGQKIQRYPIKGSMPQSPAGSIGLMLFQSILSEALNAASNSQMTTQQAAQRTELEAWLKAEQQRLNNQVKEQRAKRDIEDNASMEEMKKAMGSGFDTPMPKSDLASALSDPNVVDLRGYPADKPLVVRNLKEGENPGGTPFFGRGGATPPRTAAARQQPNKDLIKRITENRDSKKLYAKLQKLQNDMEQAKQKAIELKRLANASRMQYELYEDYITRLSKSLQHEGLSLILGFSVDCLIDKLTNLKKIPAKWNRTLEAMNNLNDYCSWIDKSYAENKDRESAENYAIYTDKKSVTRNVEDNWDQATRDLLGHIDVVAENAPLIGEYYQVGKFMFQGGRGLFKANMVGKEIRNLDGVTPQYWQQQKVVAQEIAKLSPELRKTWEELAKKLGEDPKQIRVDLTPTPAPHHGLMKAPPPHPLD